MKSIVLMKQHPCVQLAHLYEHLYVSQIIQLFRQKNLFKMSDYSLHGSTFEEGGLIVIECETYTKEALELTASFSELRVERSDEAIWKHLQQIIAETGKGLQIDDKERVYSALTHLDEAPWVNIDDFDAIDSSTIRRTSRPLATDHDHPIPTRKLVLTLRSAKNSLDRHFLPLAFLLNRWLLLAINDEIAEKKWFLSE